MLSLDVLRHFANFSVVRPADDQADSPRQQAASARGAISDLAGFLPFMRQLSIKTYVSAQQLQRLLALLPANNDASQPDMARCGALPLCACQPQH